MNKEILSTRLSPYAKWFLDYKGIEFSKNGYVLPKYIVYNLTQAGVHIDQFDKRIKPGWRRDKNDVIYLPTSDRDIYTKYLYNLHYPSEMIINHLFEKFIKNK